eukprot:209976_1
MSRLHRINAFITKRFYPINYKIIHSYHTLSPLTQHQFTSTNNSPLFHFSQRFRRGAKGGKKKREQEIDEGKRPEKGLTLDTEDYKKRMQKHVLKFQQQVREIQPRTANTSVVQEIEAKINDKKVPIKKIADVAMRGVSMIAILPHKPEDMEFIETALINFNEEFNPRCDAKSGLIMVSVPKPNDEQMASLRFAVTVRRDSCKRECQDIMKVAMNEAKRLHEYLPKDDVHLYNVALNELIKEEQEKIEAIANKKLKEFE